MKVARGAQRGVRDASAAAQESAAARRASGSSFGKASGTSSIASSFCEADSFTRGHNRHPDEHAAAVRREMLQAFAEQLPPP